MSETTAEKTAAPVEQTSTAQASATEEKPAEKAAAASEDTALGDAGKQAIDRMKAERNSAKEEARKAREEADNLRAQIEGKEKEHAAEQERRKVEAEALSKANDRILRAEVRAAAAGKLSDPADALKFIDLSEFEVGTDGEVDASQVAKAIDDLISTKPYLAAQGGQRFQGGGDGGARNGPSQPSQLSRSEVEQLAREGKHAEIDKAREEGRLNDVLGIKTTT